MSGSTVAIAGLYNAAGADPNPNQFRSLDPTVVLGHPSSITASQKGSVVDVPSTEQRPSYNPDYVAEVSRISQELLRQLKSGADLVKEALSLPDPKRILLPALWRTQFHAEAIFEGISQLKVRNELDLRDLDVCLGIVCDKCYPEMAKKLVAWGARANERVGQINDPTLDSYASSGVYPLTGESCPIDYALDKLTDGVPTSVKAKQIHDLIVTIKSGGSSLTLGPVVGKFNRLGIFTSGVSPAPVFGGMSLWNNSDWYNQETYYSAFLPIFKYVLNEVSDLEVKRNETELNTTLKLLRGANPTIQDSALISLIERKLSDVKKLTVLTKQFKTLFVTLN